MPGDRSLKASQSAAIEAAIATPTESATFQIVYSIPGDICNACMPVKCIPATPMPMIVPVPLTPTVLGCRVAEIIACPCTGSTRCTIAIS